MNRPGAKAAQCEAGWVDGVRERVPGHDKLASQLARRIEEEILRRGWPVGEHLGREEDLCRRFGVSRAVLREALAITELDGLTRRERGRHGGLAIAAPAQAAVTMALGNYLNIARVTPAHFSGGWRMLEFAVLRWAAERCTPEDMRAYRTLAAHPMPDSAREAWAHAVRLHAALLTMTHNRAARIFGLALADLSLARFHVGPAGSHEEALLALARRIAALRVRQVEGVIGDRLDESVSALQEMSDLWKASFQDVPELDEPMGMAQAERILGSLEAIHGRERPIKRSETLALQLLSLVSLHRRRSADPRLDTEPALMARFQVGRGVLREAVRYLERYSVVRMEKGQRGGLRIATPDPENAVRSAVLLFSFLGVEAQEIDELSRELELAAVSAAHEQLVQGGQKALAPFSQALRAWPNVIPDPQAHMELLYRALMQASGSPVLVTLMRIFAAFLKTGRRATEACHAALHEPYHFYLEHMRAVEQALLDGDPALARREMLWARQAIRFLQPEVRSLPAMLDRLY